jgi:hypothetical protein
MLYILQWVYIYISCKYLVILLSISVGTHWGLLSSDSLVEKMALFSDSLGKKVTLFSDSLGEKVTLFRDSLGKKASIWFTWRKSNYLVIHLEKRYLCLVIHLEEMWLYLVMYYKIGYQKLIFVGLSPFHCWNFLKTPIQAVTFSMEMTDF